MGHEETDAEVGPLVRFAIFLTLVTLVCAALTAGFYKYLDGREQAEKARRYPLTVGVERPLPPTPRLQTYPFDDLKGMRQQEAKLLEHYTVGGQERRHRPDSGRSGHRAAGGQGAAAPRPDGCRAQRSGGRAQSRRRRACGARAGH